VRKNGRFNVEIKRLSGMLVVGHPAHLSRKTLTDAGRIIFSSAGWSSRIAKRLGVK